jgi:hypothetical protein
MPQWGTDGPVERPTLALKRALHLFPLDYVLRRRPDRDTDTYPATVPYTVTHDFNVSCSVCAARNKTCRV